MGVGPVGITVKTLKNHIIDANTVYTQHSILIALFREFVGVFKI